MDLYKIVNFTIYEVNELFKLFKIELKVIGLCFYEFMNH